jgi:TolB-like protein/tetratricopeptide (TPR) repeat protein
MNAASTVCQQYDSGSDGHGLEPEIVTSEQAQEALSRILNSRTFSHAEKLAEFLEYVVIHAIRGDRSSLKETCIGIGLYNRSPGYDPKIDSLVRTQARRVRERLERYYREEGEGDPVVITIPKGGYIASFRQRDVEEAPTELPPVVLSAIEQATPAPRRTWRLVLIAAGLAAVGAGSSWQFATRHKAAAAPPPPTSAKVMVLPFRGSLAETEDHLYAHAMADSVIAALSGINGLVVTTPPEPAPEAPPAVEYDPAQAVKVRADYLITGQFHRSAENASASIKLLRVASGEVIWSNQYSFPWTRLVRTEQEMGSTVASRLSRHLGESHSSGALHVPPSSPEAYREYLAGHHAALTARKTASLEAFHAGVTHLERSLALEPGNPETHSALAGLLLFHTMPWTGASGSYFEAAETHAMRALERAPRSSDALAALARCSVLRRDFNAAVDFATRAVESEPGNAEALSALAEVYTAMGFYEAALDAYLQASHKTFAAIEPLVFGSVLAARLGKIQVAENLIESHAKVDPDNLLEQVAQGLLTVAKGDFAAAERIHTAVRETLRARNLPESERTTAYSFADVHIALAMAAQNKLDAARSIVRQMPPAVPQRLPHEILLLAAIGEKERAIDAIGTSFHYRNYRFLVTEPGLKPLWNEVRFRKLLRKSWPEWMALQEAYGSRVVAKPPTLPAPADFLRSEGLSED